MLTCLRRRLAGDDGISLVEMMVAMFVLAVALMALASSIISSLTAIGNDERLVRATQLANQTVEDLRGMGWDDVGFYSGDAGYQATFNGEDTVTLGSTRPADSRAPLPGPQPVPRDGVAYTVTTNIYWLEDLPTPGPDGIAPTELKGFHVLVEWSDRGRSRSFETSGTRSPSVDEVPLVETTTVTPTVFDITGYDISPTTVTISSSGFTQQAIRVNVTTRLRASSVTLDAGSLAPVVMQEIPDSDGLKWTHEVPSGNGSFSPGDEEFVVNAVGADGGSATQVREVTFEKAGAGAVVIQEPSAVTPALPICTQPNGQTTSAVTFTFEVHGLSSVDTASITWTDQNGQANATPKEATTNGYVFEATIPQSTTLKKSKTTVTVSATRIESNTKASQPFVYEVEKNC